MARDLGITQKSAWFMDHRIRFALHDGILREAVRAKLKRTKPSSAAKRATCTRANASGASPELAAKTRPLLWESLSAAARSAPRSFHNRKKKALQAEVRKHVEAGSALYTDALLSYEGLAGEYAHQVVDHAVQYVDGKVHTNGLENFWSLLKRGINGTYVSRRAVPSIPLSG